MIDKYELAIVLSGSRSRVVADLLTYCLEKVCSSLFILSVEVEHGGRFDD